MSTEAETYLTPSQVSERYNKAVSASTLKQWRYKKTGPTYTRVGRNVVYPLSLLLEWEKVNTVGDKVGDSEG